MAADVCVAVIRSYTSYLAVMQEVVVPASNGHVKHLFFKQVWMHGQKEDNYMQ